LAEIEKNSGDDTLNPVLCTSFCWIFRTCDHQFSNPDPQPLSFQTGFVAPECCYLCRLCCDFEWMLLCSLKPTDNNNSHPATRNTSIGDVMTAYSWPGYLFWSWSWVSPIVSYAFLWCLSLLTENSKEMFLLFSRQSTFRG